MCGLWKAKKERKKNADARCDAVEPMLEVESVEVESVEVKVESVESVEDEVAGESAETVAIGVENSIGEGTVGVEGSTVRAADVGEVHHARQPAVSS